MKMYYLLFLASVSWLGFFSGLFSSKSGQEISKIYEKKDILRIESVSADCILKPESIDVIKVHFTKADDADWLEYEVREEDHRLVVQEYIPASKAEAARNENWGRSLMTITVPENTKVEFYSISGNLQAEGLTTDIEATTRTGNIEVYTIVGNLSLKSGTGKVTVEP